MKGRRVDPLKIGELLADHLGNLLRHRRRHDDALLPLRVLLKRTKQPANLVAEASLEEGVGLVEDHVRDVGEEQVILLAVLDDSTGGTHDDVQRPVEDLPLRREPLTTDDELAGELAVVRHSLGDRADLLGELARGADYQHPRPLGLGPRARRLLRILDLLDHRQEVREGLAAARVGRDEEVPAGEDAGDGCRLNVGGAGEAHRVSRRDERLVQAELGEGLRGGDGVVLVGRGCAREVTRGRTERGGERGASRRRQGGSPGGETASGAEDVTKPREDRDARAGLGEGARRDCEGLARGYERATSGERIRAECGPRGRCGHHGPREDATIYRWFSWGAAADSITESRASEPEYPTLHGNCGALFM